MKKYPTCQMIVDADNECPFCYTTLTYEPEVFADKEKYVWNKYLVLYFVKKTWLSVLCTIVVLLKFVFTKTEFDTFLLFPIALAGFSLLLSFCGRTMTKNWEWKYSQGYSEYRTLALKVFTGLLAVVLSFVLY